MQTENPLEVDLLRSDEHNSDKTARPRILLVDDDEIVRELLRALLEMNQFLVTTAANVPEAIHLIDTEPFDVLLSDLHMPGAGDERHDEDRQRG